MKISIRYFASLREKANKVQEELIVTAPRRVVDIYSELARQYGFSLSEKEIKFSINNEYVEADTELLDGDLLVFIPPVAGG